MYEPRDWTADRIETKAIAETLDAPCGALLWLVPAALLLWGATLAGAASLILR